MTSTILCSLCIALSAIGGDTNRRNQTAVELVMVELSSEHIVSTPAAGVALVPKGIVVERLDGRLVVASACNSNRNRNFIARLWAASWDASAGVQVCLGRGSAIKAPLFAPTKDAISFAMTSTILCSLCIALSAIGGDTNRRNQTAVELVMVELSSEHIVSTPAAGVALVPKGIVVERLDGRLVAVSACNSNLHLLGSVHIETDDTFTVLLRRCNVHVHLGKGGRDECRGLDFNRNADFSFF